MPVVSLLKLHKKIRNVTLALPRTGGAGQYVMAIVLEQDHHPIMVICTRFFSNVVNVKQ